MEINLAGIRQEYTKGGVKESELPDNPLLLFANEWSIRLMLEHNEGLELEEFRKN